MSTAIALLSGKGGSGKTTIALSIANLLCKCEVRTLLVDCDLRTNGATYFFEPQLVNFRRDSYPQAHTLNDLLSSDKCVNDLVPLPFKSNLDFIPSIPEAIGQDFVEKIVENCQDFALRLQSLLAWAERSYDVVLFDCQAGYTDLLPSLLPLMDADLFVLEADSISASSLRSLHQKVQKFLGNAQLFQIFNKATPEEFEIYSKIEGTFYINIGTLLFDQKIREAFSYAQVPDIDNTSARFRWDLCKICQKLFCDTSIHLKLDEFSVQLYYQRLEEERKLTERSLRSRRTKSHHARKYFLDLIFSLTSVLLTLYIVRMEDNLFSVNSTSALIAITFMIVVSIYHIFSITSALRRTRIERQKREKKLKSIDKEIAKLDRLKRDGAAI